MILPLLLFAVQAASPPEDGDALNFTRDDPPIEMIDFLGRRRQCAYSGVPADEQTRLHCATLPGEERAFRARFANDAAALRWLDQAPLAFRLDHRLVADLDSSEPTTPRRTEQSGVDDEGRPYRLIINTEADGGRSTSIDVAFAGWPIRRFALSNRDFPLIDLQSLLVSVWGDIDPRFGVRLRFGHMRGYCAELDYDDREIVSIAFTRNEGTGYVTRRTNCERVYERIPDATAR
jgi:hypothetical protein